VSYFFFYKGEAKRGENNIGREEGGREGWELREMSSLLNA